MNGYFEVEFVDGASPEDSQGTDRLVFHPLMAS